MSLSAKRPCCVASRYAEPLQLEVPGGSADLDESASLVDCLLKDQAHEACLNNCPGSASRRLVDPRPKSEHEYMTGQPMRRESPAALGERGLALCSTFDGCPGAHRQRCTTTTHHRGRAVPRQREPNDAKNGKDVSCELGFGDGRDEARHFAQCRVLATAAAVEHWLWPPRSLACKARASTRSRS